MVEYNKGIWKTAALAVAVTLAFAVFVFKFEDGLVLGDLIAFFDEQVHHSTRIRPFTEIWKFDIHKF